MTDAVESIRQSMASGELVPSQLHKLLRGNREVSDGFLGAGVQRIDVNRHEVEMMVALNPGDVLGLHVRKQGEQLVIEGVGSTGIIQQFNAHCEQRNEDLWVATVIEKGDALLAINGRRLATVAQMQAVFARARQSDAVVWFTFKKNHAAQKANKTKATGKKGRNR